MSLPEPRPGLVIRYGFLWNHEAAHGAVESSKDRPCAIIVAARRGPQGQIRTVIAPITHSAPNDPLTSMEIPASICRQLGLDDGRHWLRYDQLNSFEWPGFDLRPIPGRAGVYAYGELPKSLFDHLRLNIMNRAKVRTGSGIINRD